MCDYFARVLVNLSQRICGIVKDITINIYLFRLIAALDLQNDLNKYSKYLKTSAKRKLTFALSIISFPSIILLDG